MGSTRARRRKVPAAYVRAVGVAVHLHEGVCVGVAEQPQKAAVAGVVLAATGSSYCLSVHVFL